MIEWIMILLVILILFTWACFGLINMKINDLTKLIHKLVEIELNKNK